MYGNCDSIKDERNTGMGEQCEPEEFPNGFGGLCDACAEIGAKVFAGSTSQKINRSKQSMIYANRDGDTYW